MQTLEIDPREIKPGDKSLERPIVPTPPTRFNSERFGFELPALIDIPERFGGGPAKPPKRPKAPPQPDREPDGEHKFKVKIEEPKRIFEQLRAPTPEHNAYMFGDSPLDYPLESVSVSGISDGRSLSSLVQIHSDMELRYPTDNNYDSDRTPPFYEEFLKEKFHTKKIGKEIIILDDNNQPEFQVGLADLVENMFIGVGRGRHMGKGVAPLKRLTTFPDFDTWLKKYAQVIETTVNAVYEGAKRWSPDIELILRPQLEERPVPGAANLGDLMAKFRDMGQMEDLKDKLQIEKPNVKFNEIGGQEKAKREIEGLAFALKNPDLYQKWGTKPPKGVLLYGPPGTGKTLMAKALATEADAQFLSISISDITSKWYGESEKLMKEVFEIANEAEGKTILFFDEIDAIAPDRDASSEPSRRIVSTLLTNLDGIGSNPNVMMVCATNRLDSIDPALTRPGRLDRLVEVGLPDDDGRKQIFGIHIKKSEGLAGRELFNGVDFDQIIPKTDKSSGADIAEIIRRVLEEKVRQEGTTGIEPGVITTEDILKEIEGYERIKQVKGTIGFKRD